MRIVCPSCQAAYDIPQHVLTPGRKLRCAKCAADFAHPTVSITAPLAPEPDGPKLSPPIRALAAGAEPKRRRGQMAAVALAWAASFVLLASAGWAMMNWRTPIMQDWPPSTRLYAALGYAT